MQRYKSTGLSLPFKLLEDIDSERGDIPRSRFLLRLIVKAYGERQIRATNSSKFEESFSDLLSERGDSSPSSRKDKSESGHKIAKSKQGSLDIRFPPLPSSESRIPQQ